MNTLILQEETEKMMNYSDKIVMTPGIMLGKPVIKGTRITVEQILRKLSDGMTVDELLSAYTHLTREDVFAALTYASDLIANEEIIIPQAS